MALTHILRCPVCDGSQFTHYLTCRDHTKSGEDFNIQQCKSCSFLFTNPSPDAASIGRYYQSESYISHTRNSKTLVDKIYLFVRRFSVRWKMKLIAKAHPKGTLLDYGCGTGEFLNEALQQGWQCSGVEPSANARTKAASLTHLTIKPDAENFGDEKFDVITLWHVLEHIHNLQETIATLAGHLKPGGIIFIAVPNHESRDGQIYREHWAGYDVPRHLWHFTSTTMSLLLRRHNLRITEIIPMKLDAYYVALLSEKYKNEKRNIFNRGLSALRNGFASNFAARSTQNYSSLIYVVTP